MQSDDYAKALQKHGVLAIPKLPSTDIEFMQSLIDSDFYGGASEQAQDKLIAFCERHTQPGDVILLACTELPLAFPDHIDDVNFSARGLTFVNPSAAHIAEALALALSRP